jgi:HlyD family secretion protein/GAF domain
LCNELSTRTGASRVSIGWMKGRNMKVKALSHTEKFDKKQELIVQIEKAMEECVDQEEPVRFEFDGQRSENVTRAAQELSRLQGGNSVLSLPLRRKDEVLGVLTLEFAPPAKLPEQTVEALAVAADLLTPQLKDRFDNDRWLIVKTGHSIKYVSELAIGPKHMLAKLVIAGVLGAAAFVTFYKPMYHVSAPFQFAAIGKQPVSIPFDGQISHIAINPDTGKQFLPGDKVKAGWALAVMDTKEQQQRLFDAQGQYTEAMATAEAARAAAIKDRSKAGDESVALAKADSAMAQIKLYNQLINDATMRAAFDGVIVRFDDPDTKRGLAAKRGDVLMEIARTGEYRAELAISDRDIQNIIEGGTQPVTLSSSSFPGADEEVKAHIDRIATPGEAKEGDNVFKVYATIDPGQERPWIRPGMAGESHVDIGKRRLVWIWTHRLVEFLKLKLWM